VAASTTRSGTSAIAADGTRRYKDAPAHLLFRQVVRQERRQSHIGFVENVERFC
jgi:hypothetical protein